MDDHSVGSNSTNARITVRSVAGEIILQQHEVPETCLQLKSMIAEATGVAPGLQKLIVEDSVFADDDATADLPSNVTLVVDESPMFAWNIRGNPNSNLLDGQGSEVRFINEASDYVNVVTCEPVMQGKHYFQFVMHTVGDEQWCGVTRDGQSRAGAHGASDGYFYYSGRRGSSKGALHAPRERQTLMDFAHVKSGDIIGMFLDMATGLLGFDLNGNFQGATQVPTSSGLYLTTSVDRTDDHVVLRKLPLTVVGRDLLEAIETATVAKVPYNAAEDSSSDSN